MNQCRLCVCAACNVCVMSAQVGAGLPYTVNTCRRRKSVVLALIPSTSSMAGTFNGFSRGLQGRILWYTLQSAISFYKLGTKKRQPRPDKSRSSDQRQQCHLFCVVSFSEFFFFIFSFFWVWNAFSHLPPLFFFLQNGESQTQTKRKGESSITGEERENDGVFTSPESR